MRKIKRRFQEGGFPQEAPQQMMPQESGMQSMGQSQGPSPEEIGQQIQQAIQQGQNPAEILIALLQGGLDEQIIIAAFQAAGFSEQELMQVFQEVEQMMSQQAPLEGMPPESMEAGMPPEAMPQSMPPEQMQSMQMGGPMLGEKSFRPNRYMPAPPVPRNEERPSYYAQDVLRRYIPKAQLGLSMMDDRVPFAEQYGNNYMGQSSQPTVREPFSDNNRFPGLQGYPSQSAWEDVNNRAVNNMRSSQPRPSFREGFREGYNQNAKGLEDGVQLGVVDPFAAALTGISLVNKRFANRRYNDYQNQMRNFGMADNVYQTVQNPLNRRGSWDVNQGLLEPDNYVPYLQSFQQGGQFDVDTDTLAELIAAGVNVQMI